MEDKEPLCLRKLPSSNLVMSHIPFSRIESLASREVKPIFPRVCPELGELLKH